MTPIRFLRFLLPALFVLGCGDDDGVTPDGDTTDGGLVMFDGGADAGRRDGGPVGVDADWGDACAVAPETCNGADDDCDGITDEGAGDEIGCGAGECVGGACDCSGATTCGTECVDTDTNTAHCGGCRMACSGTERCRAGACCATDLVDVLFLVDNSNSMTEEQASLAAAFPRFVTALTTGDIDGDGTPDVPAIDDLHVGVISSDMGVGGVAPVPTCTLGDFGDDGVLLHESSAPGCDASYPLFLSYAPGDSTSDLADDLGCVATLGIGGCGFEQQLEAVLKAVTPATSSLRFHDGTTGHADGANTGFLRAGSVMAMVVLTDENDCSASDPQIFDPTSSTYTGDLNLRCFTYPSALHPVSRYVDGLLALRPSAEDVIFTLITGLPTDLVSIPSAIDYDEILADPRMQEVVDSSTPSPRLVPSCDVPGRGLAFPPRRLVDTARALDARGAITLPQSICQDDFTTAVEAIAARIAGSVTTTCP